MSIERYFCVDSKEGLPHIKKIIPSKAIAILRPNDDAIKKFRKTLLLLISKKYIPLKTYFISDSNKGLPHIKKIILSIFYQNYSENTLSFFIILYYQIVFVFGIICYVKNNS